MINKISRSYGPTSTLQSLQTKPKEFFMELMDVAAVSRSIKGKKRRTRRQVNIGMEAHNTQPTHS
jgi:hypothetical protein